MENIDKLINSPPGSCVYVDRTGPATCALLASKALAQGQNVLLLALERESFHELLALARLFIPALSASDWPLGQALWERPLLAFPTMRLFGDRDEWANRMASFYALSQGRPRCMIMSPQSLLLRYMPKNFFVKRSLDLALGNEFSPELIIDQAVEWGYERVQMVTRPGELAKRGDILDIFPAGYQHPTRIEFFGDNIEEMRVFDGETQRSLSQQTELTILPAYPVSPDPNIIHDAQKRIKNLSYEKRLNDNQAYSLKKRLEEGGQNVLPGLAYADYSFFEEWLPPNPLWILPGEAESVEALMTEWLKIKESLEEEDSLEQPAALVLRRKSQAAPWNGARCLSCDPLRLGVETHGVNLAEKDITQFASLFPLPEDKDRPWQTLVRSLKRWQSEKKQILFAFPTARGRNKFLKLAEQDGILPNLRYAPDQKGLYALISPFRTGAELEWDKTLILGEDILYPRASKQPKSNTRAFKGLDSFESLVPGALMVHRDYGIARYGGLHHLEINNAANDYLLLEYSGNDKLYVPVDRLSLIQRFRAQEGIEPALDRLGTQAWVNGKEKARKAIEKIAADLVQMYAYRKVAKGFRYPPPGELYHEFEATFAFEETPDQARTIHEVLADMEKDQPMDRLVCGDVGFGKTEVALRAAFRAASEGRQVALLCPTTVLAEQHYQTFRSRLAGFPINVGLLSRFVPRAKQKEVLKACEAGQIDILIGTHRLLSADVKLPKLGLLILDEEQRFGVRHKEKLKEMKKNVDVLTLTATPIPRTLQLSMSGIRDLSIMETAPVDRKPVASAVLSRDDETLRKIVKRELDREGQVFWVYNRVHDIEKTVEYVTKLAPEARIGMAHGQMGEKELEETMRKFWHGELDILVCTSIVESGLDFPRANTLIVDQAQMFGLGQLYQLRGRVGRSDRQAYAFFVVPEKRKLSDIAQERLRIILDMDYLGAGFQVAMEDLRLRGAGNILGEAQSGHMTRVGLDLYLEMLEEEVNKLKGQPLREERETELNLAVGAHIPSSYIEDGRERLRYYKALSSAQDAPGREEIALAMRDRFGHFPQELENFLAVLDFKQFLASLEVEKADVGKNSVKLVWRKEQKAISPERILQMAAKDEAIKVLPPDSLLINMDQSLPFPQALNKIRKQLHTELNN